jgi:hypothetical protein
MTRESGQAVADVAKLSLKEFEQKYPLAELSWAKCSDVIDVWIYLLEGLYPHLPLKRAMYGYDPVRALEHLRSQIPALSTVEFHRELINLINRLRDKHTQSTYEPWKGWVATLPFLVEEYGGPRNRQYIVSKVDGDEESVKNHRTFAPGARILLWNGVPFDRALDLYAEREAGGRAEARRARALETLTVRSLRSRPLPDEQFVVLDYTDGKGGKPETIRLEWRIITPERAVTARQGSKPGGPTPSNGSAIYRAVSRSAEDVRRAKKFLFNRQLWVADHGQAELAQRPGAFQDFLTAESREVDGKRVGYLRVWSFDVDDDDQFIEAAVATLSDYHLPQDGLIVDLRDNPGGLIPAAERLLELFTREPIIPTRFAFRATPLTKELTATTLDRTEFRRWATSLALAPSTGETYSSHLPVTRRAKRPDYHYPGPVVLVVNAKTYSAGDLFAAGWVDNRIGPVVCIGDATGGGGAEVWSKWLTYNATAFSEHPLPPLPQGFGFTVAAMRAVRSGQADGVVIEDNGIPGQPYFMTERDICASGDRGNSDLIRHCAEILALSR